MNDQWGRIWDLTRRDLHLQIRVHLFTMQFDSDLLDELGHVVMSPAQHFRQ